MKDLWFFLQDKKSKTRRALIALSDQAELYFFFCKKSSRVLFFAEIEKVAVFSYTTLFLTAKSAAHMHVKHTTMCGAIRVGGCSRWLSLFHPLVVLSSDHTCIIVYLCSTWCWSFSMKGWGLKICRCKQSTLKQESKRVFHHSLVTYLNRL